MNDERDLTRLELSQHALDEHGNCSACDGPGPAGSVKRFQVGDLVWVHTVTAGRLPAEVVELSALGGPAVKVRESTGAGRDAWVSTDLLTSRTTDVDDSHVVHLTNGESEPSCELCHQDNTDDVDDPAGDVDLAGEVNAVVRFQPLRAGRFSGPVDPMDPDGDLAGYDGPTASPTSSHIEHLDNDEDVPGCQHCDYADHMVRHTDHSEGLPDCVDCLGERADKLRAALAELGEVGDALLGMADQHLIDAARARRAELQANYDTADATVAAMHAAAMGGPCPPVRGLVQDVADLRAMIAPGQTPGSPMSADEVTAGMEVLAPGQDSDGDDVWYRARVINVNQRSDLPNVGPVVDLTYLTVTVLVHQVCGHLAGLVNTPELRRRLELTHAALHAAGYHGWQVRTEPLTDELCARLLSGPCDDCRIDPVRALGLRPN